MKTICVLWGLLLVAGTASAANTVTKETLKIDRDARSYYLFVPESIGADPAPLVITLHGSGRDGRSLVDLFRDAATKERFIVVGPDAANRAGWQTPTDGPAFLYFLIEAVKAKHAITPRRVYLFGHSAGAEFALVMGLMESEYFAGIAVHSAALPREGRGQLLSALRKLPIAMFHGTSDNTIPITVGREGRDALLADGFPVELHELVGYEHNTLYTRPDTVIRPAWEFLKQQALADEPRYQVYR
jgi:poly(3-hydroxybutyrate) depolymerase